MSLESASTQALEQAPDRPALRLLLASARAGQWWHFVLLPAAGLPPAALASMRADDTARLGLACAVAAALLAYAYGLNAWTDRGDDLSGAKNPLIGRSAAPGLAWWLGAQAVVALGLGLALGVVAAAATAASLTAATVYSAGPRLKARRVVGTLLNAGIFAPLLVLAVPSEGAPAQLGLLLTGFLVLLLQNQLLHELADQAEDARAGVATTARWLGIDRTRRVAVALGLAGAAGVCALAPSPLPGTVASLGLLAATALAAIEAAPAARRRAHRFVALAAGAALWLAGGVA